VSAAAVRFKGKRVDVVIDVRSRLEFWMGHIDDAVNIAVDVVAEELPRRPGIARDARSAAAAAQRRAAGYVNVIDGGGMAAAAQGLGG
jgi:rhodanese-related sulfurtransferase